MIGNIKEIFPPKTGLREKQDPGYIECPYCMLHGNLRHGTNTVSKEVK